MSDVPPGEPKAWGPVRPDVAHGVVGRTLFDGEVKVTLIRVLPGGAFTAHRDAWGHLFCFLSGEGRVHVGGKSRVARADVVVTVPPGETHSYENTGPEDLVLVSLNLPRTGELKKWE